MLWKNIVVTLLFFSSEEVEKIKGKITLFGSVGFQLLKLQNALYTPLIILFFTNIYYIT